MNKKRSSRPYDQTKPVITFVGYEANSYKLEVNMGGMKYCTKLDCYQRPGTPGWEGSGDKKRS